MSEQKKVAKRGDNTARPRETRQRVLVYENRITKRGGLGLRKHFEWRDKKEG